MRFTLKNPAKENIYSLMRKIDYHFQGKNEENKEIVFVRPPRGYPRFHLFLRLKQETDEIIFDLHLDQKKPIYKGTPAHAGEYSGETVEKEAARIKQILQNEKN